MLNIMKKNDGKNLTIFLEGRLDSFNAPDLEKELISIEPGTTIILDFEKLEYLTSAGLRILLNLQQNFEGNGEIRILHVNEDIMEIFDMTGFSDILNIE